MKDQHECKHEQEFIEIKKELANQRKEDKKFVSWVTFWSIIGAMMAVFFFVEQGNIDLNKELTSKVNANSLSSATIQAQLTEIQKDILEIKVNLKEHSVPKE